MTTTDRTSSPQPTPPSLLKKIHTQQAEMRAQTESTTRRRFSDLISVIIPV